MHISCRGSCSSFEGHCKDLLNKDALPSPTGSSVAEILSLSYSLKGRIWYGLGRFLSDHFLFCFLNFHLSKVTEDWMNIDKSLQNLQKGKEKDSEKKTADKIIDLPEM